MNTIVMNTLNGAVTEHALPFHSVTAAHAGSASGLFVFGGDTDQGTPIATTVTTGKKHWGSTLKKYVAGVYFAIKGPGTGRLIVHGENVDYPAYSFPMRAAGVTRCVTGRGIRENYLAFSHHNVDGADFRLDRVEVLSSQSANRRI